MRHALQQLPLLRELLADVDSQPVQKLREKMGEFTELRELLERAVIDAPPVLVRDGGSSLRAIAKSWTSGGRWPMAPPIISINWRSASASGWASIP